MKLFVPISAAVAWHSTYQDVELGSESPKCQPNAARDSITSGEFPKGFKWSFATAAYQIEGAYDKDGKGQNIWDKFSNENNPCHVEDCQNGNDACKSYMNMDRDVGNMAKLGVQNYRFSFSWARLCPKGKCGVKGEHSAAGIKHYHEFLDKLSAANIEPFVTLYHWDLPQALQDEYGGWANETVVDDFGDYARFVFQEYGDKVKNWITLNESEVVCDLGYGAGFFAPGLTGWGPQFHCRHHTVLAHVKAYHIYDSEFRASQGGRIGITMNTNWYEPNSDSQADKDASQRWMDDQLGFWADPIYRTGDYPPSVLARIPDWALPRMTDEQKKLNLGTADFFGLNHYTTSLVEDCDNNGNNCGSSWNGLGCSEWPQAGSGWLFSVPWGFRRILSYIDQTYDSNKYPVFVTENGISSRGNGTDLNPELDDDWRISHYTKYIGQMKRSIDEDKVNVEVYTAWSLMDNFEWTTGYHERFGLMWTNFTSDERHTYFKDSARFFGKTAMTNCLSVEGDTKTCPKAFLNF